MGGRGKLPPPPSAPLTPAFVCIAARGTSDNAARYAQYLFGGALRMPVMLATPSLHTLYSAPPDLSRALVIGISQSGAGADVRQVLDDARQQGALTLALTNVADSPVAQAAQLLLELRAGAELSVAASKTYTAQLTVVAMLAAALADDAAMRSDLAQLPELAAQTLSLSAAIAGWSQRYHYANRLVTLGRGFNYATACEIALKVKELIYIASEGYSEADFRHGPIACIDALHPVIVVAPSGITPARHARHASGFGGKGRGDAGHQRRRVSAGRGDAAHAHSRSARVAQSRDLRLARAAIRHAAGACPRLRNRQTARTVQGYSDGIESNPAQFSHWPWGEANPVRESRIKS